MFDETIVSNGLLPILKPELARLIRAIRPHSMVSRKRMQNLWRLLRRVEREHLAGDFVELGVAGGGTAVLLAHVAQNSRLDRQVFLVDAFELHERPDAFYEDTRRVLFDEFEFDTENVHLRKAWFQDAVREHPERSIALLHIDANGYEPVLESLEGLWPRITPGGWIVFDNYGSDRDCHRAVDAFVAAKGLRRELRRFGRSQAYFQKRPESP